MSEEVVAKTFKTSAAQRKAVSKWSRAHPETMRMWRNQYRERNPDKARGGMTPEAIAIRSRRSVLKKYGLTEEHYQALLAAQSGMCAICKNPGQRRLCIDHDHVTGQVRGLLCDHCNRALGSFNDDPALLQTAANYLTSVKK